MSLLSVAKQIRKEPCEARVVYESPAVILEFAWQPQSYRHGDCVKTMLFTFYEGELCRIGVTYDQFSTEGLSVDDMIEAISALKGRSASASEEMLFPSISKESVKVLARWEDSKYSFNLLRGNSPPAYGMVMFSKRLQGMAETAAAAAARMEADEGPQREADRVERSAAEHRALQENTRKINKEGFRP